MRIVIVILAALIGLPYLYLSSQFLAGYMEEARRSYTGANLAVMTIAGGLLSLVWPIPVAYELSRGRK